MLFKYYPDKDNVDDINYAQDVVNLLAGETNINNLSVGCNKTLSKFIDSTPPSQYWTKEIGDFIYRGDHWCEVCTTSSSEYLQLSIMQDATGGIVTNRASSSSSMSGSYADHLFYKTRPTHIYLTDMHTAVLDYKFYKGSLVSTLETSRFTMPPIVSFALYANKMYLLDSLNIFSSSEEDLSATYGTTQYSIWPTPDNTASFSLVHDRTGDKGHGYFWETSPLYTCFYNTGSEGKWIPRTKILGIKRYKRYLDTYQFDTVTKELYIKLGEFNCVI